MSEENSGNSGNFMTLVLFILNIIIVTNTSHDDFELVISDGGLFYQFHKCMMWFSISTLIALLIFAWLGGVSAISGNDIVGNGSVIFGILTGISILVLIILQYWQMGVLWHRHPEHTLMFYNEFWTDGLTHFPKMNNTQLIESGKLETCPDTDGCLIEVVSKHWPYVMSDVVVRIYGFILIMIPVILGLITCCFGSMALCGRLFKKNSSTPTTSMHLDF